MLYVSIKFWPKHKSGIFWSSLLCSIEPILLKLCQKIRKIRHQKIIWQSSSNIGSIYESSELQKIPNLCFVQKLIEAYNMPVVIYVYQ